MPATRPFDALDADIAEDQALTPTETYKPYPIDWRFLPEELLILKDFIRHHLSNTSNLLATNRNLSRLWVASLGSHTISSIARAGILFIHVPKAGGTSISQCLYGRNLPHYSASFYRTVFASETATLPSFAIIRHPVERFTSTYAFLRNGGTDVIACDRFDRLKIGDLTSIDAVVDRLYTGRADLSVLPSTFQTQSEYVLGEDGGIMVDRLFSLDRASGFSPELGRWLGYPNIPRVNSTGSEVFLLSETSCRKINDIYSQDFDLYRDIRNAGGVMDIKRERLRPPRQSSASAA